MNEEELTKQLVEEGLDITPEHNTPIFKFVMLPPIQLGRVTLERLMLLIKLAHEHGYAEQILQCVTRTSNLTDLKSAHIVTWSLRGSFATDDPLTAIGDWLRTQFLSNEQRRLLNKIEGIDTQEDPDNQEQTTSASATDDQVTSEG